MRDSALAIVLVVFAAHVFRGRPPVETLLFSVALAVGLSPELLPAILSVNLARGAQLMARHGVLVRRLNAIENLGSTDVLCTDKTGTLTDGVVQLEGSDAAGAPSIPHELVRRVAAHRARHRARRAHAPAVLSQPAGPRLLASTLVSIVVAVTIPYLPYAQSFGFVPLPGRLMAAIAAITALYVLATELAKRWFYRRA